MLDPFLYEELPLEGLDEEVFLCWGGVWWGGNEGSVGVAKECYSLQDCRHCKPFFFCAFIWTLLVLLTFSVSYVQINVFGAYMAK